MLELYTHCVRNRNKYGLLTTVTKSWFFKVDKHVLFVSKLVELDELLQQVYNVLQLASDDPDPETSIPPLQAPIIPLKPESSEASSSSRNEKSKQNQQKTFEAGKVKVI